MSQIRIKREFHPVLMAIYILSFVFLLIYVLCHFDYNNQIIPASVLLPVFPSGIYFPKWIYLIVYVLSSVFSVYFIHEVLVKRTEANRRLYVHYFIIPLMLLSTGSLAQVAFASALLAVLWMSISFIMTMAVIQLDINRLFLAGLMAGLLFLFNDIAIVFILIIPVLMIVYRIFTIKAFFVYLLAFFLPALYAISILYLTDFSNWPAYLEYFYSQNILVLGWISYFTKPLVIFLFVSSIIFILRIHIHISEYKIAIRRAFVALLSMCLLLLVFALLMGEKHFAAFFVLGLSVVIVYYVKWISDVKRKFILVILYVLPLVSLYAYSFLCEYVLS